MLSPLGNQRALGYALSGAIPKGSVWWNPDGATPGGSVCVVAYQPKGAASYAASKINIANPGTYDAQDGIIVPFWSTATGWEGPYLNTGLVAGIGYSFLVLFGGTITAAGRLLGALDGGGRINLVPETGTNKVEYANGGILSVSPALYSGVLGMAGDTAYRNGYSDGTIPVGGIPALTIFINSLNTFGVHNFDSQTAIRALAIYNTLLTGPQMLARSNAMLAL